MATALSVQGSPGRDFWLLFMKNFDGEGGQLWLDITAGQEASGSVSVPGMGYSREFQAGPGRVARVPVPAGAVHDRPGEVLPLGVHIESDREVSVVAVNRRAGSAGTHAGIPVQALGTGYLAASYPGTRNPGFRSQLAVLSPADGNRVTIIPSADTEDGRTAWLPFELVLNRGEAFLLSGAEADGNDLTGSLVAASSPVAVFSGATSAYVPFDVQAGDHLVAQLPPVSGWGTTFVTRPLQGRLNGDTWRFIASMDATLLQVNGDSLAALDSGQFFETILLLPSLIEASRPVLAVQYAHGGEWDDRSGDPFMVVVPPVQQFAEACTFAVPAEGFSSNYLNLIVREEGLDGLFLDGVPLPPGTFQPVAGSAWATGTVPLQAGAVYELLGLSSSLFMAMAYGWGDSESYGFVPAMGSHSLKEPLLPEVVTSLPEAVAPFSARLGGAVAAGQGLVVPDRGIYLHTAPDPAASGSRWPMGEGTGRFSGLVEVLQPNTDYHVVAYAVHPTGLALGQEEAFRTPPAPPQVITSDPSEITAVSARIGGEVLYDGNSEITDWGVFWGPAPDPPAFTQPLGGTEEVFTGVLEDLQPSTSYSVQAYAVNEAGMGLGEVLTFITREPEVFLPNAFAPGSSRPRNRVFLPEFQEPPQAYELEVFGRTGARIFHSKDPQAGWDGQVDGRPAPQGTYTYRISYRDAADREHVLRGAVLLLR